MLIDANSLSIFLGTIFSGYVTWSGKYKLVSIFYAVNGLQTLAYTAVLHYCTDSTIILIVLTLLRIIAGAVGAYTLVFQLEFGRLMLSPDQVKYFMGLYNTFYSLGYTANRVMGSTMYEPLGFEVFFLVIMIASFLFAASCVYMLWKVEYRSVKAAEKAG